MKKKGIVLLLGLLILVIISVIIIAITESKQRVDYELMNLSFDEFLTEDEKQKGLKEEDIYGQWNRNKVLRIRTEKNKTNVYISMGKYDISDVEKIKIKILKIKEKNDNIVIYAKENGHCVSKTNGLTVIGFHMNVYQTLSIQETEKPIEVVWRKPIICS